MIAALSKYWRPVSRREYWHEMGLEETKAAVEVAAQNGLPQELIDQIWEKPKRYGIFME